MKRCASEGGLGKVPWMSILILLGTEKGGRTKENHNNVEGKKNTIKNVEVTERLTVTF